MLKQKKYIIGAASALVLVVILIFAVWVKPTNEKTYKVKRGNLEVTVNCKGEINGEKYKEINIPKKLLNENLRVYQLKIMDVIPEGKVVKKGDYIAKLDESNYSNMMQEVMKNKEVSDADLKNSAIDSAVSLNSRRENINNALLDLQYNKIDLELSQFESPAYQRKSEMQYKRAEMNLEKLRRDYQLEKNRARTRVARSKQRVDSYQERIDNYIEAIASTTITAPEDGIVMFAKNRRTGKPLGKDAEIDIYRPLIATLPDMSSVVSESYIREIDISKVQIGDSVRITVDALPDKIFWGKVINIANVGEDHRSFDMKAFKIKIRLNSGDDEMKPGMSANNDIIVASHSNKLIVPLKAIFTKNKKQMVYVKSGGGAVEQEVVVAGLNDEFAAINDVLKEGDTILLYQPEEYKQQVAER